MSQGSRKNEKGDTEAGQKPECEDQTEGGFPLGRQMKGQLRMTVMSDRERVNDGQSDGSRGGRAPNP